MSTRHRAVLATLAALPLALSATPAAGAQSIPPWGEVEMPYPGQGTHTVRFEALSMCHWDAGKGNGPLEQMLSSGILDLDVSPIITTPIDLGSTGPTLFNAGTMEWTNTATGRSGRETAVSTGREMRFPDVDTGIGPLRVTITAARSPFPVLGTGSADLVGAPTHTETIELRGIDPVWCEGPIDAPVR